MADFDDIGFLLRDVARMCHVDAARIVTGDAIAASLGEVDPGGLHVVASEDFEALDGTPACLLLLSLQQRRLTGRELGTLRAMALHARMQLA